MIKDLSEWRNRLNELLDALSPADDDKPIMEIYKDFENDTFKLIRKHWLKDDAIIPNQFHYKPTNFYIKWLEWHLVFARVNQDLSQEEFEKVIDDCIKSLK